MCSVDTVADQMLGAISETGATKLTDRDNAHSVLRHTSSADSDSRRLSSRMPSDGPGGFNSYDLSLAFIFVNASVPLADTPL